MKNAKQLIPKYSSEYLIVVTFLCGYSPPLTIPPIFLGLIAILAFQLIIKNRVTGIIIASLFLLINVLMLLAVVSEFNKFLTTTSNAIQLLLIGFLIFGFDLERVGESQKTGSQVNFVATKQQKYDFSVATTDRLPVGRNFAFFQS